MKKIFASLRSIGFMGFLVFALVFSLAAMPFVVFAGDVTLGAGVEELRTYVLNGGADVEETWVPFMKGQMGDYKISLSQTTASPTATALAAASQDFEITITLSTYDDEVHAWYYGPVGVAVSDDCVSADATITPSATSPNMSGGIYVVTVTLPKGTYNASEDVVLTVSDPTYGFGGWAVSDVTFTATVQ